MGMETTGLDASAAAVRSTAGAAPVRTESRTYRRRPGPRFMMPLKIDIGVAGVDTSRGFAPGIGAAVGIHWASLSPRPSRTTAS